MSKCKNEITDIVKRKRKRRKRWGIKIVMIIIMPECRDTGLGSSKWSNNIDRNRASTSYRGYSEEPEKVNDHERDTIWTITK